MTRYAWAIVAWGFLLLAMAAMAAPARAAEEGAFDGEWRTSIGIVKLKQTGSAVTGTYGQAGQFTLKGTVEGKNLTFERKRTMDHGRIGALVPRRVQTSRRPGGRLARLAARPRSPQGQAFQPQRPLAHGPRPDGTGAGRRQSEGAVRPGRRLRHRGNGDRAHVRVQVQGVPPWRGLVRPSGRRHHLRRRGRHRRLPRLVRLAGPPCPGVRPPCQAGARQDRRRI